MFKYLIAVLLIAIVACNDSLALNEFKDFMKKFDKNYETPEEKEKRFNNFKKNLEEINTHNKSSSSHKKGINQFTDWTKEEFQAYVNPEEIEELNELNKLNETKETKELKSENKNKGLQFLQDLKDEYPDSFDWRQFGIVSPVKSQGSCGAAWAFSLVAMIESQVLLWRKQLQTFSEQQLIDCGSMMDPNRNALRGCKGGAPQYGVGYIRDIGLMSDKDYPYQGIDSYCKFNIDLVKVRAKDIFVCSHIQDPYIMIEKHKEIVKKIGPASITLDASEMIHYKSGIFKCRNINKTNYPALLIGWGSENGNDYWIIKMSFGRWFGEDGFIRISQNVDQDCGIRKFSIGSRRIDGITLN